MGAPPSDAGAVSDAVTLVPVTVMGVRLQPGAPGAVMGATAVKFQPSDVAPLAPLRPSMAIMYAVPLVTAKVMVRYVWPVGAVPVAFVVSDATDPPVYAPSSVANALPLVENVTLPSPGATQRYQVECAPPLPP